MGCRFCGGCRWCLSGPEKRQIYAVLIASVRAGGGLDLELSHFLGRPDGRLRAAHRKARLGRNLRDARVSHPFIVGVVSDSQHGQARPIRCLRACENESHNADGHLALRVDRPYAVFGPCQSHLRHAVALGNLQFLQKVVEFIALVRLQHQDQRPRPTF